MVQEFPELQGVVGGLYAAAQGEPNEVSEAIYDHYLPEGLDDRCPRTVIGAIVSLADKVDSVVAGFAAGLNPTGSSDPFGLRRQANAIIKVLVEFKLPIFLRQLIETPAARVEIEAGKPPWDRYRLLLEFFEERLRFYLETGLKFRYDTVRAILAAGWDSPLDAARRAEALESIRKGENFEALSMAAKRIKNILAKSATASDWRPGEVNPEILNGGFETELYQAFSTVASKAKALADAGDYTKAFESVACLRPQVDRFFDKVLVMAEDRAVRENRLRLLGKLYELFSSIAHLSEIAPDSANVDASTSKAGTRS
jgi:glycyl-tRNA synthetase beta chain